MATSPSARWQRRRWIVDGHNAIFALPIAGRLQREQHRFEARLHLERMLMAFATRLEKPLLVVYDGNEITANPDARREGPLHTLYSQPPEEADDRIVYLADRSLRQGESVAIVTDDRKTLVPRLPKDVQVWGVREFWNRFLVKDGTAPDPSGESGESDEFGEAGEAGANGEFGANGTKEKTLSAEDRDQIAALFLERSREIESAARRGARRREREAAARWAARTGAERDSGQAGPVSSHRRRESEPVTDEMDVGWDPNRVFESLPPRGTQGGWGGSTSQKRDGQSSRAEAARTSGAAETAGSASESDRAAREARKKRGERKQARRLQQTGKKGSPGHKGTPRKKASQARRKGRKR